jgi:plastocyanin
LKKSVARTLAACAATTVLAAGCGSSGQAAKLPHPKGDIQAVTYDYEVLLPSTVTPGVHTIGYTNRGLMSHEIVMFKTDLSAFHLPLKADGSGINEDSPLLTKVADSGDALKGGGSKSFQTSDLTPGHYVAVCNLPSHYKLGMAQDVTVK